MSLFTFPPFIDPPLFPRRKHRKAARPIESRAEREASAKARLEQAAASCFDRGEIAEGSAPPATRATLDDSSSRAA